MANIGRLWRTIRHLKPVQVYGRFWFRLQKPRPDLAPAPALRALGEYWCPVPACATSMTGPLRFRFLNEEHGLADVGWDDPSLSKLWRYNLHYFNDLRAEGWADRTDWHQALITCWIVENPPGQGSGWEPYPMSLRIVNWAKWHLAGGRLSPEALESLAIQVRALADRMEWHLLGNHLFVNAKALVFAGHVFDGSEAAGWRATGLRVLRRELDEQFLTDGGQFELSPMYHALGFEDLLDLLNLAQVFPGLIPTEFIVWISIHAERARLWLDRLSHPDGRISFFNDAAFGIAPENFELELYADRLNVPAPSPASSLEYLTQSGYARLMAGPAVLLADLARIGPDYLPGHAHADTLSFELSLEGRRIIVNSGTSVYGLDPLRLRQRGTAAHSTLMIDGLNSSEVWSGFRVGRRARPSDVSVLSEGDVQIACAAHDGYRHLPGAPLHWREWRLDAARLIVTDRVEGEGRHRIEIHFHLSPGLQTVVSSENGLDLFDESDRCIFRFFAEGGSVSVISNTWHPEFGISYPNLCIVVSAEVEAPHEFRMQFNWIPL